MSPALIRGYEVVIGLETHAQLSTQSKIFSGASTQFGAEPNTQACAVDLALPGSLPVMNTGAVERAITFGLAVGAKVAPRSIFARKNYFYPDLPKGYQISQYEVPVVQGGTVSFFVGDAEHTVQLVRAHLEEDAGKSLHEDFHGQSGIDLNRAGTPLLEIVTEPDMRSSKEAAEYARALHALVVWLGICDGNMQEGSFRCDANVSVRRPGAPLGTRREIKNLNSFKFLQQAIDFEVQWQIDQIEDGLPIQQATVLFNPDSGETKAMRTKEDAHDYRYFPDPDLPPLVIGADWVERVRAGMPELPRAMAQRFQEEYAVSPEDARLLTHSKHQAWFFEKVLECMYEDSSTPSSVTQAEIGLAHGDGAAKFLNNELAAALNKRELVLETTHLSALHVAHLLVERAKEQISRRSATDIVAAILDDGISHVNAVRDLIEERNLRQLSDVSTLEMLIEGVLAANAKSVEEFRAGKEKAFNALVGQAMKATKGKANPAQVNDLLKKKLAG